jgi:hypothetical protein
VTARARRAEALAAFDRPEFICHALRLPSLIEINSPRGSPSIFPTFQASIVGQSGPAANAR